MFDLSTFETALNKALTVYKHKRILLGCSGGVDSVLLAHFLKLNGFDFGIAHINYGLREVESDEDADFVQQLAKSLDVESYCKRVTLNTSKSIQEEARTVRYQWFDELCQNFRYDFIATAHHLDDSIEGMIMSVFSGASLYRLSGISDRSNIIRPLQNFTKDQILEYAGIREWLYREDSSNLKNDYLRNYVRNKVLVDLQERSPFFKDKLLYSLHFFQEQKFLNDAFKQRIENEVMVKNKSHTAYSIDALSQLFPLDAHLRLLFQPYGFTDFKAIRTLFNTENGKRVRATRYQLVKFNGDLLFSANTTVKSNLKASFYEGITEMPDKAQIKFTLEVREDLSPHKQLEVRPWKTEDCIRLKGINGIKKVSKLLRDFKVDPIAKSEIQVLLYEGQLLSVLGYATDMDFLPRTSESHKSIIVWSE